jgi:hypothetical protein
VQDSNPDQSARLTQPHSSPGDLPLLNEPFGADALKRPFIHLFRAMDRPSLQRIDMDRRGRADGILALSGDGTSLTEPSESDARNLCSFIYCHYFAGDCSTLEARVLVNHE